MNRVIALIMIILIALAIGCITDPFYYTHVGNWQWVESVGGITGETRTPQTEGYNMLLEITPSKFIKSRNDSIINDELYTLERMPNPYFADSVSTIMLDNEISMAFELSDKHDTLFLYDNCYDCFAHTYLRIK